jgi:type III pantothenate kinase
MSILAFDIGNTLTKMATFQDGKMVKKESKPFDQIFAMLRSSSFVKPEYAIVSSVTKAHNSLIQFLDAQKVKVTEFSHNVGLPIDNQYATPQSLGMDRLAAAAGAHVLYPNTNCLIIDAGTCIKFEYLTQQGVYMGGNITPGLQMRIDAMHHFTAKLPVVEKALPELIYGTSTTTALQNGALRGAIYEIRGTIAAFQARHKDLKVILAGGDAAFLHTHLGDAGIIVEPDIVLYGLHHTLQHHLAIATK